MEFLNLASRRQLPPPGFSYDRGHPIATEFSVSIRRASPRHSSPRRSGLRPRRRHTICRSQLTADMKSAIAVAVKHEGKKLGLEFEAHAETHVAKIEEGVKNATKRRQLSGRDPIFLQSNLRSKALQTSSPSWRTRPPRKRCGSGRHPTATPVGIPRDHLQATRHCRADRTSR